MIPRGGGGVQTFNSALNARLCERDGPKVFNSIFYTAKHHHLPAQKCDMSHEHCVSQIHPFPGDFGNDILKLKPSW